MTSNDWTDLGEGLVRTLAYAGVGVVLLVLGFLLLDKLTPGDLGDQIMVQRQRGATRVAAGGILGLVAVIATAVIRTQDDFTVGIVNTAVFGLVGIVLQGVAFLIVDKLTPGDLGATVSGDDDHPGTILVAATLFASGILVAACIS